MGELHLFIGPMFSGKTTELLRRVRGEDTVIIKYDGDRRPGVWTHDQISSPALSTHLLEDVKPMILEYRVIGIDEAQFFTDLVDFCSEMMTMDKIIFVAGLDGDYLQRPFGDILQLIPICDSVVKLNAICVKCFNVACFSKRTNDDDRLELIGDEYIAVCRKCIKL